MENKRNFVILLLITISIGFHGCTTFLYYPRGVWECRELGIILDFDDTEGLHGAAHVVRGTIVINDETIEIVCKMDATGSCGIAPIEDMGKSMDETNYFYIGIFSNKGKDKMTFKDKGNNVKYTFVKQDTTE